MDFGGLAEEQGSGAELGDNRRAVDVVARRRAGHGRRSAPRSGPRRKNIDWWPRPRGARIAAGRQLRQLRRRKGPCGIAPQRHEFDRVSSEAKV
jgi:hypothetical protein